MKKARNRGTERAPERKKPAAKAEKTSKWLYVFFGAIFTMLAYALDTPAKINSFFHEKDAAWHNASTWFWNLDRYKGRWTNDEELRPDNNLITDGSIPEDKGDVQLELTDSATNEFTGEIETSRMENGMTAWSRVFVSGHVWFGGFRGEIWDVVGGHHRTFAYFKLKPSDKFEGNSLQLFADQNFNRIVPSETTLWRTEAAMNDGKMGIEYRKALLELVNEIQKKKEIKPNHSEN